MSIFGGTAKVFALDDKVWARHANPWSVWTRVAGFLFIVLAIWSRVWLGWWSLVPIAAAILWLWWNPRAFPPPSSTDNWASKGVLGERVYINRSEVPIPAHHQRVLNWIIAGTTVGTLALVYGLYSLDIWATVAGFAITAGGKLWFIDRMVWIYDDMIDADPRYRSWLYGGSNS